MINSDQLGPFIISSLVRIESKELLLKKRDLGISFSGGGGGVRPSWTKDG